MPRVAIASSTVNVPTMNRRLGGAGTFERFADRSGYKPGSELPEQPYRGAGFEWFDERGPGRLRVAKKLADRDLLAGGFQSWRSTTPLEIATRPIRDPDGTWNGKPNTWGNALLSLVVVAGTPPLNRSHRRLERVGAKLPITAHPNEQEPPGGEHVMWPHKGEPRVRVDYKNVGGTVMHQPSADTIHRWGIPLTAEPDTIASAIVTKQQEFGFSGVALDTKRLQETRNDSSRIGDAVGLAGALAAENAIQIVRVNLSEERNLDVLRAATHGELGETPHGQITAAALESPDEELTIVTQITPADFHRAGVDDIVEGHRRLIGSIVDLAA